MAPKQQASVVSTNFFDALVALGDDENTCSSPRDAATSIASAEVGEASPIHGASGSVASDLMSLLSAVTYQPADTIAPPPPDFASSLFQANKQKVRSPVTSEEVSAGELGEHLARTHLSSSAQPFSPHFSSLGPSSSRYISSTSTADRRATNATLSTGVIGDRRPGTSSTTTTGGKARELPPGVWSSYFQISHFANIPGKNAHNHRRPAAADANAVSCTRTP